MSLTCSGQMRLLPSLWRLHSAQSTPLPNRIRRPLRRMDQPTWLHHIDCPSSSPLVDLLPVFAFVGSGVGDGDEGCGGPLEGDDADVGVAYGCLAEEVEAVL
jgi:hypothetical protein